MSSVSLVPEAMVVVPAGAFRMGAEDGYAEEAPEHEVRVPGFAMDRYPVTNGAYQQFCDTTGRGYPRLPRWAEIPDSFTTHPDHPVVNIGYTEACAYAAWVGKRLPNEAEWEYAARGGQDGARYPWGDVEPTGAHAQYATRESAFAWREWRYSTGYRYTAPVGAFPPNPYGLYDMAGNVWEWCAHWFYDYPDGQVNADRAGEGWGLTRVLRGGAFYSPAWDLRASRRLRVFGGVGGNGMGFRCVADLDDAGPRTTEKERVTLSGAAGEPEPGRRLCVGAPRPRVAGGVELCAGTSAQLTEERARQLRDLGFSSVEQYVTWETVESRGEGEFDFSAWDEQVEILRRYDLAWVPFLIAGPAYSLPDWYRRGEEFRGLVCLEHRLESHIQSIWDRRFDRHIDRFLRAFCERYRDGDVIESLLLGITGDFGEAIYPVTGTTWTTIIPGPYHTHSGYWCGDRYAKADFRRDALRRYDDRLDALNRAWGTRFRDPAEIDFPRLAVHPIEGFRVDEHTGPGAFAVETATDRRRWLDFIDWYRGSMNALARAWIETARRHCPDHSIYLCTGGHAPPEQGAHLGDQCRLAADYGAGVRITNEASNYARNFSLTQWVASAGRFYGAYVGFEPAGGIDEKGVTARIYNATVSGARNLHFYADNILSRQETVDAWMATRDRITLGRPVPDVAVLYPDTAVMSLEIDAREALRRVARLREAFHVDVVDDHMVAAGALERYHTLVLVGGTHYEASTLEAVREWSQPGIGTPNSDQPSGLLAAFGTDALRSVTDVDYAATLFPVTGTDPARIDPGGDPGEQRALWLDDVTVEEAVPRLVGWLHVHDRPPVGSATEGVYATRLRDRIVVLHHGNETCEAELSVPDGSFRTLQLAPNSLTDVAFTRE